MVTRSNHRKILSDRRRLQRKLKPLSVVALIATLFLEANYDLVNRLSAKLLLNLENNVRSYRDCPSPSYNRTDDGSYPKGKLQAPLETRSYSGTANSRCKL